VAETPSVVHAVSISPAVVATMIAGTRVEVLEFLMMLPSLAFQSIP